MVTNVEPLLRLPKKERMEVAERLWLSVADEQRMLVPANHKNAINERLTNYKAGKSVPVPHSVMMKRLRAQ
ncbi:MAG: addiction module protein [Blastochloris sp.]|nr:addiction module protein [Blastochloris sp.]